MQESTAFTLTELPHVIAIIAIFASILLSASVRPKEAGKNAADLSNLQQLGFTQITQSNDNENVLAPDLTIWSSASAWVLRSWITATCPFPSQIVV